MIQQTTNTNVSFNFLKGSDEFLNLVLDNINSCVLLLNNRMELHAFNNAMKTIFTNKKDEDLLYKRCGEAIGCAYNIDEAQNCGETSHCSKCELRLAAINSYLNNEVIYKDNIIRPFYNQNNQKEYKHLQFSTRLFLFNRDKYIMLLIEDISNIKNLG